jgi:hypothetical protein
MQPINAAWARSAATLPRATYRTMRVVSAPKARKRRKFIIQAFSEFDLPFFWVDCRKESDFGRLKAPGVSREYGPCWHTSDQIGACSAILGAGRGTVACWQLATIADTRCGVHRGNDRCSRVREQLVAGSGRTEGKATAWCRPVSRPRSQRQLTIS